MIQKIVQVDKRGQIVIPKDIRTELGISSKTNLWAYTVTKEGILLKKE
jgi:AbrB family looped-hinge helix DNA binding protein